MSQSKFKMFCNIFVILSVSAYTQYTFCDSIRVNINTIYFLWFYPCQHTHNILFVILSVSAYTQYTFCDSVRVSIHTIYFLWFYPCQHTHNILFIFSRTSDQTVDGSDTKHRPYCTQENVRRYESVNLLPNFRIYPQKLRHSFVHFVLIFRAKNYVFLLLLNSVGRHLYW